MTSLKALPVLLLGCLAAAPAFAQLQLTPPPKAPPPKAAPPKAQPRPPAKSVLAPKKDEQPTDAAKKSQELSKGALAAPGAPSATADDPNSDSAFGAYQRGYYVTARRLALVRAEKSDPAAMTLLGELYANGQGIKQSDQEAEGWYKLAADRGNREAIFALAMFRLAGRNGPPDRKAAAALLESAAKLGHPMAAYNLALLYLEGEVFDQDYGRAADLFRQAAEAGNADAQYALASFYKEGRAVPQDLTEATRLLRASALAGNLDAQVEYAIALYNGTGTAKDEAAAVTLLQEAARKGSAIAQNRYARVLATGRGAAKDEIEALKWHLIAKDAGNGDPMLDDMLSKLSSEDRKKAEDAAQRWLSGKTKPS
jgi:hypothetical protein